MMAEEEVGPTSDDDVTNGGGDYSVGGLLVRQRRLRRTNVNVVDGDDDDGRGKQKQNNKHPSNSSVEDDASAGDAGDTSTSNAMLLSSDLIQQQQQRQQHPPSEEDSSIIPLSMQLLRPFYLLSYCPSCNAMHNANTNTSTSHDNNSSSFVAQHHGKNGNNRNTGSSSNIGSSSNSGSSSSSGTNNSGNSDEYDFFATGNNQREGRRRKDSLDNYDNHANDNVPEVVVGSSSTRISPSSSANNNYPRTSEKVAAAAGRGPTTTPSSSMTVVTIEQILQEYTTYTHTYGCASRLNAGILTTFRSSLPTLRVSGSFFDADMLALCEVLLRHCNGYLSYIKRLDFTLAGKEGRDVMSMSGGNTNGRFGVGGGGGGGGGKKGIRSHGAYALSKVLTISQHIEEVYLNGNRIGSYGSSAIFTAASQNTKLRTLLLRGCRIGERGAMSFAQQICGPESRSGLREVDLSACRIGFRGCYVIEEMLKEKREKGRTKEGMGMMMVVDLEGNMVFQEVMNCVSHGLGILLGTYGTYILNRRISGMPTHYTKIAVPSRSASAIVVYYKSSLHYYCTSDEIIHFLCLPKVYHRAKLDKMYPIRLSVASPFFTTGIF